MYLRTSPTLRLMYVFNIIYAQATLVTMSRRDVRGVAKTGPNFKSGPRKNASDDIINFNVSME